MSALIDIAIGLVGACLLWATFRALQMRWPESYFSIEDVLSQRISISPLRYGTFRFVPVLLIASFAAVTSIRARGNPWLAGAVVGVVHAAMTAGGAAVSVWRRSGLFARQSMLMYHLAVAAGILAASLVGVLLARTAWFPGIVPDIPELRSDLWTALFAAALGAYFVRITQGRQPSAGDLVRYSREGLGPHLIAHARHTAHAAGVDEDLVEAILLVESLQRPRWIRFIERIAGRIMKVRTYGVMQVRSDTPITDEESIQLAVTNHLQGKLLPTTTYGPDTNVLTAIVRSYNPDPRFVELVSEVYMTIWFEGRNST